MIDNAFNNTICAIHNPYNSCLAIIVHKYRKVLPINSEFETNIRHTVDLRHYGVGA